MKTPGIWGNLAQILLATAFTSMSLHLLNTRREAAIQRDRYMARITILESLVEDLRQKEDVENSEIERLLILSRKAHDTSISRESRTTTREPGVPWKDVVFGRRSHTFTKPVFLLQAEAKDD
ncbi:hypothetical protein Clacol_002628 [Clathrus columnatus]|uniref:Uncharacterized protein n=1 Tax=Clathrus columnatus TaxID=1419009 RepID=A0AAV5A4N0_9AGAM|nr:hypothetical protein Clacol_002628 [Clathrus columnatus]